MPSERENAAARWSASMQRKLDANKHKAHWTELTADHLLDLLHAELEELESDTCPDNVTLEAADVANLAFMYAEVRRKELLKAVTA